MSRKKTIESWLDGPQTFEEGLTLYKQYGGNSALLSIFLRSGATAYNCEKLEKELRALLEKAIEVKASSPQIPAIPKALSLYDPEILALIRERSHYHAQLTAVSGQAARQQLAFQILELTDKIEILLGVQQVMPAVRVNVRELPTDPVEMLKRINNNRSYISRYKDSPLKAEDVRARMEENKMLTNKLNHE